MIPEENIYDMQKQFTHIVSHMQTLWSTFQNEDLVVKILRTQNGNYESKVNTIFEYRGLSTLDMSTLFGKFQEHEMELK